jgi:hypothetical protein
MKLNYHIYLIKYKQGFGGRALHILGQGMILLLLVFHFKRLFKRLFKRGS